MVRGTGDLGEGRGFEVEEFSSEEKEDMKIKYAQSEHSVTLIKLNPGNWVVPDGYLRQAHSFYNFKFRPDDTLVMSFPKSGTMWILEILWTMHHNPNLDNPLAKKSTFDRSPHLEVDMHLKEDQGLEERFRRDSEGSMDNYESKSAIFPQMISALKSPRVFAAHLPFAFYHSGLLDQCKVVYVARNPYDVIIAFFHFVKLVAPWHFAGDFDQFIDYYMQNKVMYTPYWGHIKQAWEKRHHPHFHFVFYENLQINPEAEVRRIDKFLQTNLTDQQIQNVLKQSSFDSMKTADNSGERAPLLQDFMLPGKVGGFFRKGQSGGWKTTLNAEQKEKISKWIKENTKDCDIEFIYE